MFQRRLFHEVRPPKYISQTMPPLSSHKPYLRSGRLVQYVAGANSSRRFLHVWFLGCDLYHLDLYHSGVFVPPVAHCFTREGSLWLGWNTCILYGGYYFAVWHVSTNSWYMSGVRPVRVPDLMVISHFDEGIVGTCMEKDSLRVGHTCLGW